MHLKLAGVNLWRILGTLLFAVEVHCTFNKENVNGMQKDIF